MSVLVDDSVWPYRGMLMCHMLADTPEELIAMADKIGVSRKHFQLLSFPHFDICKSKRVLAIKAGAKESSRREMAEFMKRMRPAIAANPEPWRALCLK